MAYNLEDVKPPLGFSGLEMMLYNPSPMEPTGQDGFSSSAIAQAPTGSDERMLENPDTQLVVVSPPQQQPLTVELAAGSEEEESPVLDVATFPRRRAPRSTRLVDISYVSFDYHRMREGRNREGLRLYEDKSPPTSYDLETLSGRFSCDEKMLPEPAVLKGWQRETRVRISGLKDKFYSHPWCSKLFRSVVELLSYVKSRNNLDIPNFGVSAEDGIQIRVRHHNRDDGQASLPSLNRKRMSNGFLRPITRGRNFFPVAFDEEEKDMYKQKVEDDLAHAYNNLMNLFSIPSSSPSPRVTATAEDAAARAAAAGVLGRGKTTNVVVMMEEDLYQKKPELLNLQQQVMAHL